MIPALLRLRWKFLLHFMRVSLLFCCALERIHHGNNGGTVEDGRLSFFSIGVSGHTGQVNVPTYHPPTPTYARKICSTTAIGWHR